MAKKFKHHHTAAGDCYAKGDHAGAMHHVGHMMSALRRGDPEQSEPSIPTDDPMEANAPQPSLRDRLSQFRRLS